MSKQFKGTGWKFPIQVDPTTGAIMTSSGDDDIKESIGIILGTKKGERVMRNDFGSDVFQYVFSDMSTTNKHLLEEEIKEALMLWEPRITDVEVDIEEDNEYQNKYLVNIEYTVRSTNNLFNLVYPFYIYEGVI